jgi:hypothetical protein
MRTGHQRKTERIMIESSHAEMMRRRCHDLIMACTHEANIIDAIALSCYQQGLMDAFQVLEHRPTLPEELRALEAAEAPHV